MYFSIIVIKFKEKQIFGTGCIYFITFFNNKKDKMPYAQHFIWVKPQFSLISG